MIIRKPQPGEAAALSDLALRSKGYWGYNADFLRDCREEFTVQPRQIAKGMIRLAEARRRHRAVGVWPCRVVQWTVRTLQIYSAQR